jgi:hypothetical protein
MSKKYFIAGVTFALLVFGVVCGGCDNATQSRSSPKSIDPRLVGGK